MSKNGGNRLLEIKEELKAFIANQNISLGNIPEFKQITKIDKEDENLELVPEGYLETDFSTIKKRVKSALCSINERLQCLN